MVDIKANEIRAKEELVGKVRPLVITDNSSVAVGSETYILSLSVPKKEHWIIDKIHVTALTGDNISLSRILLQPNNVSYDISNLELRNFKPANIGQGLNYIDLVPPIVLDQDQGVEKVEFRFSNSGTAAQTLGIVISGIKVVKQ